MKCQRRREELLNGSIETADETSNHALMLKKEKEIEKLRSAFKINPDRIEGDYAFVDNKKKASDEKRKPTGNWLLRDNDIREIEQAKKSLTSNNNVASMALGKEKNNQPSKPVSRNYDSRDEDRSSRKSHKYNSRSRSPSRSERHRNRSRSPRR